MPDSYTLPLLPGYGANVKVRSSVAPKSPGGGSILHAMDQAEETGYVDSYFPFEQPETIEDSDNPSSSNERSTTTQDGQIYATSPENVTSFPSSDTFASVNSHDSSSSASAPDPTPAPPAKHIRTMSARSREPKLAEAIFFDYGVSVFFGACLSSNVIHTIMLHSLSDQVMLSDMCSRLHGRSRKRHTRGL